MRVTYKDNDCRQVLDARKRVEKEGIHGGKWKAIYKILPQNLKSRMTMHEISKNWYDVSCEVSGKRKSKRSMGDVSLETLEMVKKYKASKEALCICSKVPRKRDRENKVRLHEVNKEPPNTFIECYDEEANGLAQLMGDYALQTARLRIMEKLEQEFGIQRFNTFVLEESSRSGQSIESAFLPALLRYRKAIISGVQLSTETLVNEVIKEVVIKELRKEK